MRSWSISSSNALDRNTAETDTEVRLSYKAMNTLLKMYSSLLVDVRHSFKVPIGLPEDLDHEWVLIEAPKLDKALLAWLEGTGDMPVFPEWLAPLWDEAQVRPDPILRVLRTVLNFAYKAEYDPTTQQIQDAEEAFMEVEAGVEAWDTSHDVSSDPFLRRVRLLIWRILKECTPDRFRRSIPHHGPGAVYPRFDPEVRSNFVTEYSSISSFYPWDEWFQSIFIEDLATVPWVPSEDSILCKMVAVPKDSRGPRLICVHPREAIWIQQSQRAVVEGAIERSPITSGLINFDDQSVNGALALRSSMTQEYFTLDLKEASDRLSKKLVDYLLGDHAAILGCARASHVRLLSGRIVTLKKWAPMGNCLTFPVESLIFWAIGHVAMELSPGEKSGRSIYVFGDDVIGPTESFNAILSRFVQCGLVPNMSKTFRNGPFRESCGVDALLGRDITPLRTKVGSCHSYSDAVSLCSLAQRALGLGFTELSDCIYLTVSRFMEARGKRLLLSNNPDTQGIFRYIPVGFDKLASIAAADEVGATVRMRWNSCLHRWETRYDRLVPSLKKGPWRSRWNVVDSLVRLERGLESSALEYAFPGRCLSQPGWTPTVM